MATSPVNVKDRLNDALWSEGILVNAPVSEAYAEILTHDALRFLAKLSEKFEARRQDLLAARADRQREIEIGRASCRERV